MVNSPLISRPYFLGRGGGIGGVLLCSHDNNISHVISLFLPDFWAIYLKGCTIGLQ